MENIESFFLLTGLDKGVCSIDIYSSLRKYAEERIVILIVYIIVLGLKGVPTVDLRHLAVELACIHKARISRSDFVLDRDSKL
jgi:hypothetical protein